MESVETDTTRLRPMGPFVLTAILSPGATEKRLEVEHCTLPRGNDVVVRSVHNAQNEREVGLIPDDMVRIHYQRLTCNLHIKTITSRYLHCSIRLGCFLLAVKRPHHLTLHTVVLIYK